MIYYPVALKTKAYYQESNDADFVNTDKLLDQVISLPMHHRIRRGAIEVYYWFCIGLWNKV